MASAQSLQSSRSDKLKEDTERKPDDNCMTCSLCKFHDNSRNHCDNPVCSWLAMDKEEREKHLKHMKNCILAPFLFGKKMNYSLKSITWLKSLKLIPITRSSPSRSCLSDRLIEVADVVEEIVDNLVSSLVSEEFLHSSYHIYKELTECYLVEDAVLIAKKSEFVSLMGCCFNGSYCLDNKKIHLLSLTVLHQAMKYVCQTAKPGDCLTKFEEVVKRREPVCTELRLKGNAHFAAGEYQIAVACYSQAIKFSPFDPLLYGNRSQSYLKLKKLREALTDAKRTIYLRPEWEKGHYRFAQAYFELGFLEKAVAVNSFAQKCCSSTLNLLCQAVVFKRETEESAKKNRAHCCNPKGEQTVDNSHQHQQAYCNNPCFSNTKLGNKRNWKVANQTEAHDPVSKSSLKKDTDQHLPGSVDETNDCNPSDDNEDLELELSDTESIPPLIYDSSDDDDDCDDLISLSGGSDLSDLPGLASCGESDTESLDSDSEFDSDDSDDHDDDLSFSDVGCECCNCGCCDEDLDNGDDEEDDDISSESEVDNDGDSDEGIDNVDILRSLMSPPILNGEVSPLLLLGVIHEFLSAHPEMMNEGSPPALPEVIESLPQAKVTKEHVATNSSCSICQCDYEENETVLQLPCAHLFHPPCITTWLKNGSPDDDVEPRGQGANRCIYWVTKGGFDPWVRLPHARASHVRAARNIKHMMSGNLSSEVISTPWFPGGEEQLLRAQIARITSTCTLAPKGWFEVDEEAPVKNTLRMVEGAAEAFPSPEELATQGGWVHAAPFLLSTGKSSWPDVDALEGKITEEQAEEIKALAENEPEKAMLEGIEADLEELKPEEAETGPAWSIKNYGDEGVYSSGDGTATLRVTALRSMIWPGAVTAVKGTRFANLYVGYGMKCGSLVGPEKESGLPLRGTMPLMPLAPEDIMDEPVDLEEHEEPNPIQDEAESDKGELEEDPDQ